MPGIEEWRAMATQNGSNFVRDTVDVFIALRTQDGTRYAQPMTLILGDPVPPLTDLTDDEPEPTVLPLELARALLESLVRVIYGYPGDVVDEIDRLKREAATANRRLDQLIAGIGSTITIGGGSDSTRT